MTTTDFSIRGRKGIGVVPPVDPNNQDTSVLIGSVDISINKAWTARAFNIPTKDLGEDSPPGQDFYGITASNEGKVMVFAGGIPLTRDGHVVGAVGVSGGIGAQDQEVAEAAAEAF